MQSWVRRFLTRWPDTKFGFAVPQVFVEGPPDQRVVTDAAQMADAAGCHSLWTQSQLVGNADVLEQISLLSYVAAVTQNVCLGTAITVVTEHSPIQLAKQLATLDVLSAGRLIVGLGVGGVNHRVNVGGFPIDRPVRRLLESIHVLRSLWGPDPASFDGELWQFSDLHMNPKPVQHGGPPLWLGGRHPNGLRRAARHGSGWMGQGSTSTEEFASISAVLTDALDELAKDHRDFTISKRVYVAVEDDRRTAEQRVTHRFLMYNNRPERGPIVTLYGDDEQVRDGIQEIIDLGADLVVLNPLYDFLRQQERLLNIIYG